MTTMPTDPELDKFFSQLEEGMYVKQFLKSLNDLYGYTRLANMAPLFRSAKKPVKTLRDEITPLARFLRKFAAGNDQVHKPKKDPPDFVVTHVGGLERTIECTTAGAVARSYLMRELNETGVGRGFVGLADDEPAGAFVAAMTKARGAFTSDEIFSVVSQNLKNAIERKSKGVFGHTLLVEGLGLHILHPKAWQQFVPELTKVAKLASNFEEVYFVGYNSPQQIHLRLK